MRKAIGCSVALVVLAFSAQALLSETVRAAAPGVRLLETGEFHGDEVSASTGQRWLGLYASKRESALVLSTVKVERVHDPIVDNKPNEKTGKKVSVRHRPEPVFLVRGTGMLRAGRVTTVHDGPTPLTNRSSIRLNLAGVAYRLRVTSKAPRSEEAIADDARLVLSSSGSPQVLYALNGKGREGADVVQWQLLWAGDVDRDNRLDLYILVSDHYNVTERRLFLSSQARKGRLVHEVAEFRTVGC